MSVLIAVLALSGVGINVYQQHKSDRSDQLWNRMVWAIDNAFDTDDDKKMAGLLAMERLLDEDEMKKSGFRVSAFDEKLLDDISSAALPTEQGAAK
ncbi:hypothetical protein [Cryobacterium sp. Y29]|uniref:hypothetical protein n=1 Tax=Cryobacterium sp. Y29 TaxID=2048285 RepID=UPI0011B097D0|nr:hypothetical protein [Cryobacterium sp. Y29]